MFIYLNIVQAFLLVQVKSTEESAEFFVHICEAFEFLVEHAFSVQRKVEYVDPYTKAIFTREQLEDSSIKGEWTLTSGKYRVHMTQVAPEMALTNASSLQVDIDVRAYYPYVLDELFCTEPVLIYRKKLSWAKRLVRVPLHVCTEVFIATRWLQ